MAEADKWLAYVLGEAATGPKVLDERPAGIGSKEPGPRPISIAIIIHFTSPDVVASEGAQEILRTDRAFRLVMRAFKENRSVAELAHLRRRPVAAAEGLIIRPTNRGSLDLVFEIPALAFAFVVSSPVSFILNLCSAWELARKIGFWPRRGAFPLEGRKVRESLVKMVYDLVELAPRDRSLRVACRFRDGTDVTVEVGAAPRLEGEMPTFLVREVGDVGDDDA